METDDAIAEPEPPAEPAVAAVPEMVAPAEPEPVVEPIPVMAEPEPAPEPEHTPEPESEPEPQPAPEPLEPRTVGRLIADALKAAGVDVAFTVPGESFLGLLDALPEAGIRVVTTRHEGGAAFMAEAHGQLTGKPAACLGTRAVGAANLAIGIHTARADSTPMFALVGQVARELKGREAFQEIDQPGSIGRLAKWSVEIDSAERAEQIMLEAVRQALGGRPGPVLISLPEDLLDELVPGQTGEVPTYRVVRVEPDDLAVRRVLQQLTAARRPVILAGAGVLRSRGTADLVRLAELLEVPVIASWRRPDVFPNDHRLFLGMTGYFAADTVRPRLDAADLIVVLGARLSEIASFEYAVPRADQHWIHVDLEPRVAGQGLSGPSQAVVADARTFLRVARRRVSLGVLAAEPFDDRRAANDEDRVAYEAASGVTDLPWSGPGVHPGRVIETLNRLLPPQTVVATDAGNFAGWAARGLRFRRPGTFLGPTSGAMGFGLPAAIAASIEHPGRPVVALCGDGGFGMTMNELATSAREQATVIALVFDNQRYGTIRMHQDRRGTGAGESTDLGPIDFAGLAEALGVRGVRVDDDADFEPALAAALAAGLTTVIHLPIDRRWRSVDVLDPGLTVRPTYHLVPAETWAARDPGSAYAAPSLAAEGFIHCTDGAAAMVETANRHYREDPRAFLVLTVDLDATGSPWRFDDQAGLYPHIYGMIAPAAVLRTQPIPRGSDGTFESFGGDVPAGVRVETIYVVEATYGPEAAKLRPAARPEHLEHIGELLRSGTVIEAGGYLDLSSAILLVQAASEDEALDLFRNDVYIRTGVWTDLRARPLGRVVVE